LLILHANFFTKSLQPSLLERVAGFDGVWLIVTAGRDDLVLGKRQNFLKEAAPPK
jgi:hypothetical protein